MDDLIKIEWINAGTDETLFFEYTINPEADKASSLLDALENKEDEEKEADKEKGAGEGKEGGGEIDYKEYFKMLGLDIEDFSSRGF